MLLLELTRGHYEMVEKLILYWHFVDLVYIFHISKFSLVSKNTVTKLAIFRGLLKFKSNVQRFGVLIFLSIVTTIEVVLGILCQSFY